MQQSTIISWIKAHAPLDMLCENGGWADAAHLRIDIRSRERRQWIVDIEFTESTMEISECAVRRSSHGGEFAVSFDAKGNPTAICLLHPLWSEGDALL